MALPMQDMYFVDPVWQCTSNLGRKKWRKIVSRKTQAYVGRWSEGMDTTWNVYRYQENCGRQKSMEAMYLQLRHAACQPS